MKITAPRYGPGWLLDTLTFWVPHAVASAETTTEDVRRRTLTGRLMRAEIIGNLGLYRTLPIRQPS